MKLNLTTFFMFSILLIIITISTNKKYNATAAGDLITATCMKTTNPQLCEQVLRSYPDAARRNLHSLGELAIQYATSYATTKEGMFERYLGGTYEREIERDIDMACRSMYSSARTSFTEAGNHFANNEYEQAMAWARNAYRVPDECQELFADNQSRKGKRMKNENEHAKAVFNIPFTIARELHQPGGHQYS